MNFEKDILISYAHIDDAPLIEGQKGWISEFHRSLELRLAQLLGKKPNIWRDPKLQGNDYFGDEIFKQLSQIALLVSVISPRYVKSDWCIKEVNQFFEVSEKNIGVRVKNKSRIFKVIKTPVKRDEAPAIMRDMLGYEFYKVDPETGRAKEFSKIFGIDNEQAYWQTLDDLAYDIRESLELLSSESVEEGSKYPEEKLTVYLAETSNDLKEYRESIRRELQQYGYRILPDQNLPLVDSDFKDAVKRLIAQSSLSLHLIGNNYGIVPEGTQKSIVELQNEIAVESCQGKKLQRLIWVLPNVKTDDLRQNAFINLLRHDSTAQTGADLLEASLEEVKFAIHEKLKSLKTKEEVKEKMSAKTTEGAPQIYLICDQKDVGSNSIKLLEDFLFEKGFEVTLPVFEGDETQIRIDYQESLNSCTGAIIYFGAGNELWLRSKMRDFMKVAGYGRITPLDAKAVYIADPLSDQKERFRSHELMVINGINGFNPQLMNDYIDKIKSSFSIS
jgi:hypothetical protein